MLVDQFEVLFCDSLDNCVVHGDKLQREFSRIRFLSDGLVFPERLSYVCLIQLMGCVTCLYPRRIPGDGPTCAPTAIRSTCKRAYYPGHVVVLQLGHSVPLSIWVWLIDRRRALSRAAAKSGRNVEPPNFVIVRRADKVQVIKTGNVGLSGNVLTFRFIRILPSNMAA